MLHHPDIRLPQNGRRGWLAERSRTDSHLASLWVLARSLLCPTRGQAPGLVPWTPGASLAPRLGASRALPLRPPPPPCRPRGSHLCVKSPGAGGKLPATCHKEALFSGEVVLWPAVRQRLSPAQRARSRPHSAPALSAPQPSARRQRLLPPPLPSSCHRQGWARRPLSPPPRGTPGGERRASPEPRRPPAPQAQAQGWGSVPYDPDWGSPSGRPGVPATHWLRAFGRIQTRVICVPRARHAQAKDAQCLLAQPPKANAPCPFRAQFTPLGEGVWML